MPYVSLSDLLDLPDISDEGVEVLFSDDMGEDPIELLHRRAVHFSRSVLVEAYRRQAISGTKLGMKHLSKSFVKSLSKCLCRWCAVSKITRRSFKAKPVEELTALTFLEIVTADIAVYLNCESREGYKYCLVFTDVATKMFWQYPLKERTGKGVLRCVTHLVEVEFRKFPGTHVWQKYHADGGKELIDSSVQKYLLKEFGTTVTWSSTDSPEMNSVSERKFRTLGELTLATLRCSGRPTAFWWDAYDYVCVVTKMMPTRTCKGWMSPMECVPGGKVPDLSRLKVWGCKAYVLIPKANRRKDWEDKSMIGHFMGLSTTKVGYKVMIGDTIVTSVHALFDEKIPPRSEEYHKELDEQIVKTDPEPRQVEDFMYLVGEYHMDDGLMYKTTRVVVCKRLIVGFRALVLSGRQQIEEKTPIHIADIKDMTEVMAKGLKRRCDKDDGLIHDASLREYIVT
jgi:hypothetical protein